MRKAIAGFEGLYEIDTDGNIYSLPKKGGCLETIILKPFSDEKKCTRIGLRKNNRRYTFLVHRLVALTFIPNPENKPQVNHIDGNKLNNDLTNLEWCTRGENIQHAYNNRLLVKEGIKNGRAKMTEADVLNIRGDGRTSGELSRLYNVTRAAIRNIRNRKSWAHL